MNKATILLITSLVFILVNVASAQQPTTWERNLMGRTEPSSSSGSNYAIPTKIMQLGSGWCGGVPYGVWVDDDFTAEEADHHANWLHVYEGLSKAAMVAPPTLTYNCFPYALGPSLVWFQGYGLPGCILDTNFSEVSEIEDADIAVHYGHHYQTHEDMVHASKVIVLFTLFGNPVYGLQGKYGTGGVYKSGSHFPAQYYGVDLDDDLFYVSNP